MLNTIFQTTPRPIAPPAPTKPTRPTTRDCSDLPVPSSSEWYEAYHCRGCEEISINTGYTLYECPEDGTCFTRPTSANNNNQCPVCSRFSRKIADFCCYECEAAETDDVLVYDCPVCGDMVLAAIMEDENG